MTAEDEHLLICLCIKAAAVMEEALSTIRPPFDSTEDMLNAIDDFERRVRTIAKLAAAAVIVSGS